MLHTKNRYQDVMSLWIIVKSTGKISDSCIRDFEVQSPPTLKTDWCLGLMTMSYH